MHRSVRWKFHVPVLEGQAPRTWIDLLLFDQVVRHIVKRYEVRLDYWNIHRRWGPTSNHVFEFRCRGDDALQAEVQSDIKQIRAFQVLNGLNPPIHVELCPQPPSKVDQAAAHVDENWGEAVKKSHPKFMQGLCETLGSVIDAVRQPGPPPNLDTSEGLAAAEKYYREIEERVRVLWFNDGSHAYLHFLHMVFGYRRFGAAPGIVSEGQDNPAIAEHDWLVPPLSRCFVFGDIR